MFFYNTLTECNVKCLKMKLHAFGLTKNFYELAPRLS